MKFFVSLFLTILTLLSFTGNAFAATQVEQDTFIILHEENEVTDKDELYERAIKGISCIEENGPSKAHLLKDSEGNILNDVESNILYTTQLLKSVQKENGIIENTYVTTIITETKLPYTESLVNSNGDKSFSVDAFSNSSFQRHRLNTQKSHNNVLCSTNKLTSETIQLTIIGDDLVDPTYSIRAYSTIYFTQQTEGIYSTVNFYQASGSWTLLDGSVTTQSRKIKAEIQGHDYETNIWAASDSKSYYPSSNSGGTFSTGFNHYYLDTTLTMRVRNSITLTRGGTSWIFNTNFYVAYNGEFYFNMY